MKIPGMEMEYHVSEEMICYFREIGHVIFFNVCSKVEINVYREQIRYTSLSEFPGF